MRLCGSSKGEPLRPEDQRFPRWPRSVAAEVFGADDAVARDGDEMGVGRADGSNGSWRGRAFARDGAVGQGLSPRNLPDASENAVSRAGLRRWGRKVGLEEVRCVEEIAGPEGFRWCSREANLLKDLVFVPEGLDGERTKAHGLREGTVPRIHGREGVSFLSVSGCFPRRAAVIAMMEIR